MSTPRKRPRAYLKSGLYQRQVPQLPAPDSPVGSVLAERRTSLIADLGGPDQLSTAQSILVDLAVRQMALLDAVDGVILSELPSPVDRRHRRVWQVILDRAKLAGQLETTLVRLGLERRPKPVESLSEYVRRWDAEHANGTAVSLTASKGQA